jgi:hypothetical protein
MASKRQNTCWGMAHLPIKLPDAKIQESLYTQLYFQHTLINQLYHMMTMLLMFFLQQCKFCSIHILL